MGEMPPSEGAGVAVEGASEFGKADQAGQGMECLGDFSKGQRGLLQGSDISMKALNDSFSVALSFHFWKGSCWTQGTMKVGGACTPDCVPHGAAQVTAEVET